MRNEKMHPANQIWFGFGLLTKKHVQSLREQLLANTQLQALSSHLQM